MEKILLIGAGGHARACIDVVEAAGVFSIVGLVDRPEKVGGSVLGYDILGSDEDLETLTRSCKRSLVAIGQIMSFLKREELARLLESYGVDFPVIKAPSAHLSRHSLIGNGTILMHRAVVNAGAAVGRHCILNTGCIIEHDVAVGDLCHVSTGSVVNGGARLGRGVFIGSNSTINEEIRIGDGVVIGSHSLVVSDCEVPGTYVGSPARRLER